MICTRRRYLAKSDIITNAELKGIGKDRNVKTAIKRFDMQCIYKFGFTL